VRVAEAVAIRDGHILAVGTNNEVAAAASVDPRIVSLDGLTVVPGFHDAHQHRIGNGPTALGVPAEDLIAAAISQGLTTIDELYVDEARLAELIALDAAGALRLDVNAYLPVNENSDTGAVFEPYYNAYEPGQMVSDNVRVAGLKVFTDFDNANVLLFDQRDLDQLVLERHREGWQLALKTVAVPSLDLILKAIARAADSNPGIVEGRARLEHNLFATAEQIQQIAELGVLPAINLNMPGQGVGDPGIDDLVSRQPAGSYVPWRAMFDAGLEPAGISGFPSYYVDEPEGAPFGSPIHMIYQAVTRVGNLGQRSPDELLGQAITAEEALRSLTINAAHASFEEHSKGSIVPGKLADLVVLSADPLAVAAEEINNIVVLATLIGGVAEYCDLGEVCDLLGPSSNPPPATPPALTAPPAPSGSPVDGLVNVALGQTTDASAELPDSPAASAVDGDFDRSWISGEDPEQWIEVSFADPVDVALLRLTVAQSPAGPTEHRVLGRVAGEGLKLLHEFRGTTADGEALEFSPGEPWRGLAAIRIETLVSPSWVAWREIEILGLQPEQS
jgi:predicted amidohydrolase YtcJ